MTLDRHSRANCHCHLHTHSHSETECECHNHKSAWWMLLSHHAECDLDQTWMFFGVNICVRCLFICVGALCAGTWFAFFGNDLNYGGVGLCLLSMIPSGLDFTIGELSHNYPHTNFFRAITGLLFGCGLGICAALGFSHGHWLPLACFCVCGALMQVIISFIFYAKGHLGEFLTKYEEAMRY